MTLFVGMCLALGLSFGLAAVVAGLLGAVTALRPASSAAPSVDELARRRHSDSKGEAMATAQRTSTSAVHDPGPWLSRARHVADLNSALSYIITARQVVQPARDYESSAMSKEIADLRQGLESLS